MKDEDAAKLKQAGIKLIITVNAVAEIDVAIKTQDSDILIYQNAQVGGHKGGFFDDDHSDVSDFFSVIQNHQDRLFVMAGGIVTRDDIERTLKIGFASVQIGTGFLATEQSLASAAYKKLITNAKDQDNTIFTTSITVKQARGLQNALAQLEVKSNLGFPYMHYATSSLRKHAKTLDNPKFQSLWAGTGVTKINEIPTLQDYMKLLVK